MSGAAAALTLVACCCLLALRPSSERSASVAAESSSAAPVAAQPASSAGAQDTPPPKPEQLSPVTDAPAEAGPDGVELANHQAGPEFIAVDDSFVYWTNFGDDGVRKIKKDGFGGAIDIGRNDHGENKAIAVDEGAVYWGGRSLYKQVKSTGDIQKFEFNSLLVYNLIPAKGRVYFADGQTASVELKSMKVDGTDVRSSAPAEKQDFMFATDGASVFRGSFDLEQEDAGRIDVFPLDGGAPSLFAKTGFLWKIALDSRFVYWLEGRSLGQIKRKPRNGKGEAVTLTRGLRIAHPQSLVADDHALYWTELGAAAGQGAVGRVSKSGGDARRIAEHQIVPQAVTVDDAFVYWVNFGPTNAGTVRKIPK